MKLRLTLDSDTILGCGEGLAGIIDREIAFDDYGFPYIPAKRMKGILREAALEYLEVTADQQMSSAFQELFGTTGAQFSNSFILGNGYLEGYQTDLQPVMAALDKRYLPYFTPEHIREYYTYTRAQTAIDRRQETAKEDTLRVSRVLKKRLPQAQANQVFLFEMLFRTDPTADALKLLRIACQVTRHVGVLRTRGFGEVRLELLGDPEEPSILLNKTREEPDETEKLGMYCLNYALEAQSQIICTATIGGQNTISDLAIPGSAILGAFANAYLQATQVTRAEAADEPEFQRLFLAGDVRFLPAYLANSDGERLLPVPASIVCQKNEPEKLFDLAYEDATEQVKRLPEKFCVITYDRNFVIEPATPKHEIEYHHQRPAERYWGHAFKDAQEKSHGQFFQFDVLQAGQTFKGLLIGAKSDLELLQQLIPNQRLMPIGKSQTAQYGQTVIRYEALQPFSREIPTRTTGETVEDDTFVVTLTTPMILVNDDGHAEPDPALFVKELIERLQRPDLELEKSFLRFVTLGGFIGKWGLPRQQVPALDAGSVLVLRKNDDPISGANIEHQSYGMRQEQGYGRVVVNWHGRDAIRKKPENHDKKSLPEFSDTFKQIVVYILKKRLEAEVRAKAIEISQRLTQQTILTNSLLGKLQKLFTSQETPTEIWRKISKMEDIAKQKLWGLQLSIHGKSKSLYEWLQLFCEGGAQEFETEIIQQTSFYTGKDKALLDDIRYKLGTERQKIIDSDHDEFIRLFFSTFLTHCELQNRGKKHEHVR